MCKDSVSHFDVLSNIAWFLVHFLRKDTALAPEG